MSAYPHLTTVVRGVLKTCARVGHTTKGNATILALKKIENLGGPTRIGIGSAALRMALTHIVGSEVTRQFKSGLSDHAVQFVLPPSAPEILRTLEKIPAWIAIEEGPDALWMNSLKATPEHWDANASLKDRKAQQTIAKANLSKEIGLYLRNSHHKSLAEVFNAE